jgi:hypothetical protein
MQRFAIRAVRRQIRTEVRNGLTSAINGTYIRRSAPTSVAIGMTLEVGADVRNTQAARNPARGAYQSSAPVRTSRHNPPWQMTRRVNALGGARREAAEAAVHSSSELLRRINSDARRAYLVGLGRPKDVRRVQTVSRRSTLPAGGTGSAIHFTVPGTRPLDTRTAI